MPSHNDADEPAEAPGGKDATLDEWVDTMTAADAEESSETDGGESAEDTTGGDTDDVAGGGDDSWRKSLTPQTAASTGTASGDDTNADTVTHDGGTTADPSAERDESGGKAVEMVCDPLQDIIETGVMANRVAPSWLDYLVAVLSGDPEGVTTAVNRIETNGGGGQSTLTSHSADGADWVQDRFETAAETLREQTHATKRDLLSPLFQHLNITDTEMLAQNFTPAMVAQFIVQSTVSDADLEALDGATLKRPLLAGDPSCGAGVFLVALADRLRSVETPPPALIIGQDLDSTAAKASVVNMALHGVPGFIVQGDTLRNESNRVWRIGPVTPDPAETHVLELPPEVLPDGFGSFPEGTAAIEDAASIDWEGEQPDTFGDTAYDAVPRTTALFEAFDRLDPVNGRDTPDIM